MAKKATVKKVKTKAKTVKKKTTKAKAKKICVQNYEEKMRASFFKKEACCKEESGS